MIISKTSLRILILFVKSLTALRGFFSFSSFIMPVFPNSFKNPGLILCRTVFEMGQTANGYCANTCENKSSST